jgi:drug/metabolite transporter (DMT)-like permease
MARAFRLAEATVVVPLDFLRLPLIAVVGMLFYAEPLQPAVLVGAAVMCVGIYYSVRRENRKLRD